MKELLAVLLVVGGVVGEPQAPYPPSGWKPNGPAFDLPTKAAQPPQKQQYLPPVEPRNRATPTTSYGTPEEDVSVQGLPVQEQQPLFQLSPINGQQYVGPSVNADIKNLDSDFKQTQFQLQQEKARQFARQKQFDVAQANIAYNSLPSPQVPRQFAQKTTISPNEFTSTPRPDDFRTTQVDSTTESLNEGEILDEDEGSSVPAKQTQEKVSVEVARQNVQEYPPEIFLNPLAQLRLQSQFVPVQPLAQVRAPLILQSVQQAIPQKQVAAGYDGQTHFAALPSVLAQRQVVVGQPQAVIQSQQGFVQSPALVAPRGQEQVVSPGYLISPQQKSLVTGQYQPAVQPQVQAFPQYPEQAVVLQPQSVNQLQPNQYQPQQPQQPAFVQQPSFVQRSQQPGFTQQPQQPGFEQQPQQPTFVQQPQQPGFRQQPQQPGFEQQPQQPGFSQQPTFVQQPQQPGFRQQPQPNYEQQPQQPGFEQQPETEDNDGKDDEQNQNQPQFVYQQTYQPQEVVYQQQQPVQPQTNQFQPQDQQNLVPQTQFTYSDQDLNQYYQNQYVQQQFVDQVQYVDQNQGQFPQQVVQGQDAFLQSGLNSNQQGNGIEQTDEDKEDESDDSSQDDDSSATAVATAFGTRTQPRMFLQYGVPRGPRVEISPVTQTTTETAVRNEETTNDGPVVAQATAVATGGRRKSAKLRTRRVRPVFTLDKSGHLVLAQEQ